jgi:hypothetical protein
MRPLVHRLLFLAGCLLILIGAVLLFKGSTQVVSTIGSCVSIAGLLISYIQIFFPMPILSAKAPLPNPNALRIQPIPLMRFVQHSISHERPSTVTSRRNTAVKNPAHARCTYRRN